MYKNRIRMGYKGEFYSPGKLVVDDEGLKQLPDDLRREMEGFVPEDEEEKKEQDPQSGSTAAKGGVRGAKKAASDENRGV